MSCNCFAASFEGVYLFAMLIGKWWERERGGGGGKTKAGTKEPIGETETQNQGGPCESKNFKLLI